MGEALGWKGQLYGRYKSLVSDDTIYMGAINRYYLYLFGQESFIFIREKSGSFKKRCKRQACSARSKLVSSIFFIPSYEKDPFVRLELILRLV